MLSYDKVIELAQKNTENNPQGFLRSEKWKVGLRKQPATKTTQFTPALHIPQALKLKRPPAPRSKPPERVPLNSLPDKNDCITWLDLMAEKDASIKNLKDEIDQMRKEGLVAAEKAKGEIDQLRKEGIVAAEEARREIDQLKKAGIVAAEKSKDEIEQLRNAGLVAAEKAKREIDQLRKRADDLEKADKDRMQTEFMDSPKAQKAKVLPKKGTNHCTDVQTANTQQSNRIQ